jgi:hypothetical protein
MHFRLENLILTDIQSKIKEPFNQVVLDFTYGDNKTISFIRMEEERKTYFEI